MDGYMAIMNNYKTYMDECSKTVEGFLLGFFKEYSSKYHKEFEVLCESNQMEVMELVEFVNDNVSRENEIQSILRIAEVVF